MSRADIAALDQLLELDGRRAPAELQSLRALAASLHASGARPRPAFRAALRDRLIAAAQHTDPAPRAARGVR